MRTMIILTATLAISLSACQKENNESMNQWGTYTSGSRAAPVLQEGPANGKNPYDQTGALHNRLLDYIEGHRPAATKDRKLSVTLIRRFYREQGLQVPPEDFFASVPQTLRLAKEDIHGLLIAGTSYSKPVKEALDSLLSLLEDLSENSSYSVVKAALVAFENRIQESRLSEDERSIVLKTAAVARYSVYYWMNRGQDTAALPGTAAKMKKIIRWFAGAINDIGGFVTSLSAGYAAECSDDARETVDYCMP